VTDPADGPEGSDGSSTVPDPEEAPGGPASERGATGADTGGNQSEENGTHTGAANGDSLAEESGSRRRRTVLLLVLLLLVVLGGGFGTFVLDDIPDGSPGPGTPSPTPPPAPNATGDVSLTTVAEATLLRVGGVAPGDAGVSRLRLRNTGSAAGELSVTELSVASDENDIVSPELSVDDSPEEGELADALVVRVSAEYPDGETVSVFGDDEFVPIGSLEARNRTIGDGLAAGEDVTIVLEWRLPSGTGNEVQSDSVTFDVAFTLRSTDGARTTQ